MDLQYAANVVRGLSADSVQKANSGHPGLPLGCAEIGSQLFFREMTFNPRDPNWINRDRFVLSAGHGSMLLYSLLHLTGYDVSLEDLKQFRQVNSNTPGHPEYGHTPGVETTTGPLGQGVGNAVGMAIAERMMASRFNTPEHTLIDHYVYVLAGDGCMMEGVSAEASSLAGHLQLGNLIMFYDSNEITIEGRTDLAFTESVADRYRAYGWHVQEIDGHDLEAVAGAVAEAKKDDRPSFIRARTTIAKGAPTKKDTHGAHGAPLGDEEIKAMKEQLGLPPEDFFIPAEMEQWREQMLEKGRCAQEQWEERFQEWSKANPELHQLWQVYFSSSLPEGVEDVLPQYEEGDAPATRAAGGDVLNSLADAIPNLVGGSADLAPSTKTNLNSFASITRDDFSGRNFNFGVREHAMGAIVNGLYLYGGLRPFGSTFLVFSDYMRPAVRLSALMGLPVVHVFTHDSIYVGEDGPTHQPVEHAEALRTIPNLRVYRPADAEETAQAWLSALNCPDGPSAILLTRQGVPVFAKPKHWDMQKGAYVVADAAKPKVVLAASGSEVSLALSAAAKLESDGVSARVVSMPCRELFLEQPQDYRETVFPSGTPILFLDVGVGSGWYSVAPGAKSATFTLDEFGVCGPGDEVAAFFGFSAENAAAKAKELL